MDILRRGRHAGAVLLLLGLARCGGDGGGDVASVDVLVGRTSVGELSDRFASFTVDVDRLTTREDGTPGLDWDDPRLRRLVQELSPAVLRIGGTKADTVYYDLDDEHGSTPPAPYLQVLSGSTWDATCAAARDLDLQIAFTLNAGDGPRDAEGLWTDDAARAFIEHTVAADCPVTVWELGNEVSSWWSEPDVGVNLTVAEYTADFAVARALIDEVDPDAKLAGPASAYWPTYGEVGNPGTFLTDFLETSGPLVDVVTWHYYPTQSGRCPAPSIAASEQSLLDPATFDEMLVWADVVRAARDESAPGAEVWLGETANAQCGGEAGLSDRFVAGLWWVDALGLLAQQGQQIVARQSLTGGQYHLIDADTLEPYPDYYNSILWRRLMGNTVLEASATVSADAAHDPARLRVYAHCTRGNTGAITVLALNLGETPIPLTFPEAGERREVYLLTATDRLGTVVYLDGTPLMVTADGSPPPMDPVEGEGDDPVMLPPVSYAFVVLPDADAPACR